MCKGGGSDGLTEEQATTLDAGTAAAQGVETALLGSPASTVETGTNTFTAGGDEIMTSSTTPATSGFIADATSAIGETGPKTFTTGGGSTTVAGGTTGDFDADGNLVVTQGDTQNIGFDGTEVTTAGTVMGNTDQLIGGQADLSSQINTGFANIPKTTVVTQSIDTSDLAKANQMDNLGVTGQDTSGVAGRFDTLDTTLDQDLGVTDTSGSITNQLTGADGTGGIMGGVNQIGTDITNLGSAEGDPSQIGTRLNTVDSTLNNMGTAADTTGVSGRFDTIDTGQEEAKNAQNEMVTRLMGADEFDPNSVLGKMKQAILAGQTTINDVVDNLLLNQGANQITNTTALGGLQTSLNNQDMEAKNFNTKYDTNTAVQSAAQKQLVGQITGGFNGVGTSQIEAADKVINAGNSNASSITAAGTKNANDILSAQNAASGQNSTNYAALLRNLNTVGASITPDDQSDILNRLSTIKGVLTDENADISAELRAQYTDLSNSFDDQGKLITQSSSQTGNIMRRGFDDSNNLVISAFNSNGGLINQQILDMNRMFKQMESFGYNNQGDQYGDLTPNGLGLMSGGNDTPVIQQSF